MPRTLVQKVGPESVSLQALVPWCSLGNGLMGRKGRCTGEANYFTYYKRLGAIAKLAPSYFLYSEIWAAGTMAEALKRFGANGRLGRGV